MTRRRPTPLEVLARELRAVRENTEAILHLLLEQQTDPAKLAGLSKRLRAVKRALSKALTTSTTPTPE